MKNLFFTFIFSAIVCQHAWCQACSAASTPLNARSIEKIIDSLNDAAFTTKRFDFKKSLVILGSAADLAVKNNYRKGIATNLLFEGGIYQQNGFERKALSGYYKALAISQSINDTYNIARANQQIANALVASGKLKEAEMLSKKAMEEYVKLGKQDEVVNTKNSLGSIYLEQKRYSGADKVLREALLQSRNTGYNYGLKKSFYNLGLLNIETFKYSIARQYLDSSFRLDSATNDYYGMALSGIKLADIANRELRFDAAIELSGRALEYARSISALQLVSHAIENIIVSFQKKNDLPGVVEWQAKLIANKNELAAREKLYAVNFLDILKDQHDKQLAIEKESMIMQQKSGLQSTVLVVIAIAVITLSILAYLWFKNYKRAQLYSLELAEKNLQIEKSSFSLDLLNKSISKQNHRLEESNYMKDKLLSIISHDLRHPLVNTKGILELVNLNLVDANETKHLLKQLETQYMRSLTLLDNLLFWIRGQMQGEKMHKERINVKQLIADILEDHKIPLQNKRIEVQNNVQAGLYVPGDKEMLKIIFRNLLSNAIKFTPQEGKISVSSCPDEGAVIVISDSGIGMDDDTIKKINAKQYFTTQGTGNESGSGFGLMLCRDLVEKHNGKMNILSEPGKGSTFTIQLPASMEQ